MPALTRWLKPKAPPPLPRPAHPICLIGDIHGRIDLLDKMLTLITAQPDSDTVRIVVLGDMIDRGPDSAAVVRRLRALQTARPDHVICLMGNHERMMLDFLTSPDIHASWLRKGGAATVTSYGLAPDIAPDTLARRLLEALGTDTHHWMTHLPLQWHTTGLLAVHAAADPALGPDAQTEQTLLWGHPDFKSRSRRDDLWVACGHVVFPHAFTEAGRIHVDTGAWRTHKLSAAWLDENGLRFHAVEGPDPSDR